MPTKSWRCNGCHKVYPKEEGALECEQEHRKDEAEQKKLDEENKKMVFSNAVKITKDAFDTHGGGVHFKIPKDCELIILMGNRGGGYVPYKCLLPHQVYVNDLREDFEEHDFEVISVIGVKSKDVFNIVYKDDYGFKRWGKEKKDVSRIQSAPKEKRK